jgi:hypothetical protein
LTSKVFDTAIMNCKGVFPYDFASSLEVLSNTTSLPPKWEGISDAEYTQAQLAWTLNECTNMLEYMLAYMKLDVFLLADVFECFRVKSQAEDGLEPLAFFGIPGMSWNSALKMLTDKVELIQEDELYSFFEGGIRGGMTFINKHHVETTESDSLLYIDINNLYGWALSQKLPCGEFKWIEGSLDLLNSDLDGDLGYVMEVDIHVPAKLHDKLDDLPIAPESGCPPNSEVHKLLLTHSDKSHYVVHAKLLKILGGSWSRSD